MRIGFSVFLMAVGAILAFAVHKSATGVNIHTIGFILMVAGLVGLVVTMTIFMPRRGVSAASTERTVTTTPAPVTASPTVVTTTPGTVATAPAAGTTHEVVETREVY